MFNMPTAETSCIAFRYIRNATEEPFVLDLSWIYTLADFRRQNCLIK